MNKVILLRGDEPEKILQTAIDKKVPAIMSYLSKGKWHVAKLLLTGLVGDRLSVNSAAPKKKQHPLNIQANQPVGISFKYEYGKFVFDTTVLGFEPPAFAGASLHPRTRVSSPEADQGWGGTMILAVPNRIEVVQRRSYYRVDVPESLKVKVIMWHRSGRREAKKQIEDAAEDVHNYCQGRLVDISAGGAQVVVSYSDQAGCPASVRQESKGNASRTFCAGEMDFRKGQFVGMRFTPMPYETPLVVSAQIRNILPTADGRSASLGLQIVGLEASPEGHEVLARLISIVEQYYQINQSGVRQRDTQPVQNTV
ncbi:MAG: PilZ domain-containing protein [Planctomycetota bacterium]